MIKLQPEDIEIVRNDLSTGELLQHNYNSRFFTDYIVPEYFIRELYEKTDKDLCRFWEDISLYQKLSENFIEEFENKLNWNHISSWQNLSEEFILRFTYLVNWKRISRRQKLSKEFIAKNINKLDLSALLSNNNLSEDTKTYIRMFI